MLVLNVSLSYSKIIRVQFFSDIYTVLHFRVLACGSVKLSLLLYKFLSILKHCTIYCFFNSCVELCVVNKGSKLSFSWAACRVVNYVSTRAWSNQYCPVLHPLQGHFWIDREFQINQTILIERVYRHLQVTWTHCWPSRFHWQSRCFQKLCQTKVLHKF